MAPVAARHVGLCVILGIAWSSSATGAAESNLLANGGFETVGRLAPEALQRQVRAGVRFAGDDPLLPMRWTWSTSGSPELQVVGDAHTGQHALRITLPKGASVTLDMSFIEVAPGATYSFGAWSKGTAQGAIVIYGNAFEGRRELARRDLARGLQWGRAGGEVSIPGNIRTVSVSLALWGEGEVTLDDVSFAAPLDRPYDADTVLHQKPQADADTLALVDFDGQGQCRLEAGAQITKEGGGRFGRGLRLEKALSSTGAVPLALDKMPEEGTLEFWFAPDDIPPHIYVFGLLLAGDLDVLKLQADTSETLRLCWRKSEGTYDPQCSTACSSAQSRDWFRAGQWHHVAAQWGRDAVRLYVDGVLASCGTERPLPFFRTPSTIRLGTLFSVYAWSGVIDEVRLSRVQRYGPFVPVGARWTPLVAASAEEPPAPAPAKLRPAPDFAAERRKLLGQIPPPPPGALAFGASEARPLLQGDANFKLENDSPVPGMTTAWVGRPNLLHDPDNDGCYWKAGAIPPGRYWVGVWYESGKAGAEANQGRWGPLSVMLNGRLIQPATTSDPVQVAPGLYFAEIQTAAAEFIKPGDEVAVIPQMSQRFRVARMTLYPADPLRGRGWTPESYGATWFCRDTALRLNLDAAFGGQARDGFRQVEDFALPSDLPKAPDGARALATCRISNPLSVPLTVAYSAQIRAYFRELVGEDRVTLTLQAHQRVTRQIPFSIVPDSRRYTLEAQARAVSPPELGWPEADTVSFFPGVRQSLPWPDPFTARDERSAEFSGALPGERMRFSLNGTWQTAFTTSLNPAVPAEAGLQWQPRNVPMRSWECNTTNVQPHPHGIYLRRVFTMPQKGEGKTYRLSLAEALDEATVYVNGQKVGNVRGGSTPLVCDITGAVKAGENDILVVVRDVLAIMDQDYVNPASPVISVSYLDAPGGGSTSGFGLGEVAIESSPAVAADDLIVLPSVRRKELSARLAVTNHEAAAAKVRVTATVLDAGVKVLSLGSKQVALGSGETVPLVFSAAWSDPVLWQPGRAHLYTLAVETSDADSGRRLDLLRTRFGFRESWVEGGRLYLNGAQVRLKGSTCQGGGGLNADDVQWSRGAQWPDFMDEFGYMASFPLAAIFNSSSRHNVDRDLFWETARANVLAGAARYGNHPCIIAWDLSNEWLSFLDYGGGDPLKAARRFKTLDDSLKAFDPSRWSFFNGDEDLHGLHDTFSTHYMLEATNPHPVSGFGFNGHSNYFPDGAFFRPLDQTLRPGQEITINVYRGIKYRCGEKVLMDTENLWKTGSYMPPGLTKFVGEDDVLGPGFDSGRGPIAWMWKQNIDGHRDLGVWAVCNYTPVTGVARRGHCRQCFIMPDHTHHCFAGARAR